MKIVVIDGQGGRLGRMLVEMIRDSFADARIYGIGTNSIATANMLKGGCDFGASGENPVIRNVMDADAVLGPVGIIAAHAMLGEVTPAMAEAVGGCRAPKYLIPVNSCGITVAETRGMQLNTLATQLVQQMAADLNGGNGKSPVRYLDHDT